MYANYRDQRAQDYKLTLKYFDGRGRCETIRYLLALGKRDYEDVRVAQEEWKDFKPKTPFGTMPCLETDGHMINTSVSIGRMVAKIVDLAGSNYLQQALVDAVVDQGMDLREALLTAAMAQMGQKDEEEKKKAMGEMNTKCETILTNLEKYLDENQFFVENKLSFADVQFFASTEHAFELLQIPNFLDKYPKLKALYDRVANVPQIKKYRETRPKTSF